MLVYLFKSIACLAIFFLFYKVFLEKENMHVFKRFYLLGALILSMVIPALVFIDYVEVEAPVAVNTPITVQKAAAPETDGLIGVPPALEADVLDIEPILWALYFLGLLFFGLKFIRNLFQIFGRIRRNPKQRLARFTQVLLQEKIAPHTFFNYIFLNKKKLESNEIPKEVLLHEETHARQKHSWDVVLVEFLHVLFWVNPFILFTKKAIKLNHEFLADQAVLKGDVDKTTYQNTLLSYLSPDSEKKYQPKLANAINYSSIKKRFTIMKTHTSKKAVLLRSLLVLPLLALLLYGFSETKIETIPVDPISKIHLEAQGINEDASSERIWLEIKKGNEIWMEDELVQLENLAAKLSDNSPSEMLGDTLKIQIYSEGILYQNFLNTIRKEIEKVGPSSIQVFTEEYFMPDNDYRNQIDISPGTVSLKTNKMTFEGSASQNGATSKQLETYGALAKKYTAIPIEKRVIPLKDLKVLETVYHKMSTQQKKEALPFPECLPRNPQDGASRKLMAEYDVLAKKYNTMLSKRGSIQIKKKEVDRLEFIYSRMSDKQKADAEPFPDFPEPPPPPKAPRVKNDIPPPPAPGHINVEIEELQQVDEAPEIEEIVEVEAVPTVEEMVEVEQITEVEPQIPPSPPEPKAPIDYIIEMAKKGARFMYEGKEISSDKAIELMKKNNEININSRSVKGKKPVVKLSKDPIVIGN